MCCWSGSPAAIARRADCFPAFAPVYSIEPWGVFVRGSLERVDGGRCVFFCCRNLRKLKGR